MEITEKNGHKEKGTQISYSVTKRRGVGNIAVTVYDCHTSNGDDLKACPSTLDATYTMVWTNVVKGSPASVNLVLDHGGTAPMYWTDRTTTKPQPLQYVGQV